MEPQIAGMGNTEIPAVKRPSQSKKWCFTYNNYEDGDINNIIELFDVLCKKYAFKREKGKEGTNHLQGHITLIERRRLTELKAYEVLSKFHWEVKKGNETENDIYITKIDTSVDDKIYQGGYIKNLKLERKLKIITELRPFQKLIVNLLGDFDDRKIHWVYDLKGGNGKTSIMKYIDFHYNAICCSSGKDSDIYNLFWNYIDKDKKMVDWLNQLDCFIYNVARNHTFKQYTLLENIKDGFLTNSKYECGTMNFNSPVVIVLANHLPDMDAMTEDRWNIINI